MLGWCSDELQSALKQLPFDVLDLDKEPKGQTSYIKYECHDTKVTRRGSEDHSSVERAFRVRAWFNCPTDNEAILLRHSDQFEHNIRKALHKHLVRGLFQNDDVQCEWGGFEVQFTIPNIVTSKEQGSILVGGVIHYTERWL